MNFLDILTKIKTIKRLHFAHDKSSAQLEQTIAELYNILPQNVAHLVLPILEFIQKGFSSEAGEPPRNAKMYGNYFQPQVYQELLAYMRLAYYFEPVGSSEEQALKFAVLFDNTTAALKYFEQMQGSPVQACSFQLPDVEKCQFKKWQKHAKKFMTDPRFRKLLGNADIIEKLMFDSKSPKPQYPAINDKKKAISTVHHEWKKLKRNHGNLNDEQKKRYQQLSQELVQLNDDLVQLCINLPLDNADLMILIAFDDHYQKINNPEYQYFLQHGLTRKDYNKFLTLDRTKAGENIPDITIDGKELGLPGYYLAKVPIQQNDHAARAACFGKLTNCCQSLSGESGESCAIHGLTSPDGGFYVVCQGDAQNPKATDTLLSQTWVWRSQSGALVFDSIEIASKNLRPIWGYNFISWCLGKPTINTIINLYRKLAEILVNQKSTHAVNCGTQSGISKNVGIFLSFFDETLANYNGYSDAKEQRVIYDKYYGGSIVQALTTTMLLPSPLSQSTFLEKHLNSIIFQKFRFTSEHLELSVTESQFFINKMTELGKMHGRSSEINTLVTNLEDFLKNDQINFANIISQIKRNELFVNSKNFARLTPLLIAAQNNETRYILDLLEFGADINTQDSYGATALYYAISEHHQKNLVAILATIDLLVQKGLDVNAGTIKPLIVAATESALPIVEKLIQLGADLNVKDAVYEKTALMSTCSLEIIELLVKNGANINETDAAGNTILMYAAAMSQISIGKLIELGAKVNVKNLRGTTALMQATHRGLMKNVDQLIKHGAEINLQDNMGETALIMAAESNYPKIMSQLLENEADHEYALNYLNAQHKHNSARLIVEQLATIESKKVALLNLKNVQKQIDVQTIESFNPHHRRRRLSN